MSARAAVLALAAAALVASCQKGVSAPDEGPGLEPIRASEGPAPDISVVMRGDPVAGRPVPYRIVVRNETPDVIIPISAEAKTGTGGARWVKPLVGEVRYDSKLDRFLENPASQRASSQQHYRAALAPGEALVEEFEVRYETVGEIEEDFRVLFHRVSPDEFDERAYVGVSGAQPRRYQPLGMISNPAARGGALLAGFFLRTSRTPESASGVFPFTMPSVPPAIAAMVERAGLPSDRTISASWAGGWVTGDEARSIVVPTRGSVRELPGVPISAMKLIDAAAESVSFCVKGATREEIEPLFEGLEIVPYKCLHVSVPREGIMSTLERISKAGFAVAPTRFELREALDVVAREPVAAGDRSP